MGPVYLGGGDTIGNVLILDPHAESESEGGNLSIPEPPNVLKKSGKGK
jgi:hypothetical protein